MKINCSILNKITTENAPKKEKNKGLWQTAYKSLQIQRIAEPFCDCLE